MGKVTILEPVKGEALTVTKLNSTIASWGVEVVDIDAENVHDQSVDHYNIADNAVRSVPSQLVQVPKAFTTTNKIVPVTNTRAIYTSAENLDFTNNAHILRTSFLVNVFSDISSGVVTSTNYSIKCELLFKHSTFGETVIPGSLRELKYESNHVLRSNFDETISYCMHLNNITALQVTGTVSNLQIILKVTFNTNQPLLLGTDYRAGIYQLFAEVETIKR